MALFGLTQKIQAAIERHVAKKKGEAFAEKGGSLMEWLKKNKALVGVIFGGLAAAIHVAAAQKMGWALSVNGYLDLVSAFLVGAGLLTSDAHAAEGK